FRACDQALQAAYTLRPGQTIDRVFDAEHRDGVDGIAFEDRFLQLAALGEAEDLRQRPGRRIALEALDRARADNKHPVLSLAAEHLLPGVRDDIELVPRHIH